jgi:hypothetical protein
MSKAIRIALIVVALACVPLVIYPELIGGSSASPAGVLIIAGLAAILWPSGKQKARE